MTLLVDRPHTVTGVTHQPHRTVIGLANRWTVVIESLNAIFLDGGAEPASDATALDVLIDSMVLAVSCSDDGALTITIAGGRTVTVPADPDWEAWSVTGP